MKKKPNETMSDLFFGQDLMDLEEESTDEDFEPNEHHTDCSDNSETGDDSDDENSSQEEEENDSSDSDTQLKSNKKVLNDQQSAKIPENKELTLEKLLDASTKDQAFLNKQSAKFLTKLVCCACLGDRSDYDNEIVECDGCGITVHEGCYGVSDSASISSTVSSCSTEPWFCEACKANVKDPDCELCPNRGGIFKETDVGKWVHLVCALYVPGVAFGEVDQLSSVTLFEMQYSKWGAKSCSLCDDERFARTGVCIGCDAGMCKNYFHVTCAQKAGLLSEAHHEEADQADPFYAHCKLHSDKTLLKNRQRNYHALLMRMKKRELDVETKKNDKPTPEQERIERKLKKHRLKYVSNKQTKAEPWVPTQKMPRSMNTSASACKKLMHKAELMRVDASALEFQEAQIASLTDIRKKWHIPPAFSVEFIGYYLDRTIRLKEMKQNLENQLESNKKLMDQQQILRDKYDELIKQNQEAMDKNTKLLSEVEHLHNSILALCPAKQLPEPSLIGRSQEASTSQSQSMSIPPSTSTVVQAPQLSSTPPPQLITSRTMSVPTAAALKMGVGFPLNNLIPGRRDESRILSTQCPNNEELLNECGICKRCTDQHLLAKCDTCHLHYHLGCLNPPLTRHPKKSKLYGWQCSECDKSDDSGPEHVIIPKVPRRSRIRYSKDGSIIQEAPSEKDSSFNKSNVSTDIEKSEPESGKDKLNTSIIETKRATMQSPKQRNHRKSTASVTSGNETDTAKNGSTSAVPTESQNTQLVSEVKVMIEKVEDKLLPQTKAKEKPVQNNSGGAEKSPPKQKTGKAGKKDNKKEENEVKSESVVEVKSPKTPQPKVNNVVGSVSKKLPENVAELRTENVNSLESMEINGKAMNGETTEASINDMSSTSGHHKHKKRKDKERDREKHHKSSRHSENSSDRQSSKEHKRKRKRKSYDMDGATGNTSSVTQNNVDDRPIPRIKIKFKAIPYPAGSKKSTQIFYQTENLDSSSSVYVAETVPSNFPVNSCNESVPMDVDVPLNNGHDNQDEEIVKMNMKTNPAPKRGRPPSNMSPVSKRMLTSTPTATKVANTENLECDVCHVAGIATNLVKCDECLKSYHFHCLEPPLKKTPKRRGYSWHCADCDPTDVENNK